MYHTYSDLLGGKFLQRVTKGFDRTIHVTFDDDIELFEVPQCETAADLIEGDVFLGPHSLFAEDLCPSVGHFLGFSLIGVDTELLPCLWCTVQTKDEHGCGRGCRILAFVPFVHHGFDATIMLTGYDQIALAKGAILHEHGGNIAAALVQGGFHHGTRCFTVGVCLEFKHFSFQQDFFQQFVDVEALFG